MTTKTRVLIDNAAYHIMVRGNQRQKIFLQENDYLRYLIYLKRYKNRFKAKVYSYCLMPNHVHLLLDPSDKLDLKRIMHGISMSYAKYFNHKYEKCGHLWQGRYKNYVIQKDEYLVNCATYIEMNPLKAGICQRPENYKWSSYGTRALGKYDGVLDEYISQ